MAICNICGSTEFEPAYKGRMVRGVPPACSSCKSYERHRTIREIYIPLIPLLANKSALQFAPDISIDRTWFARFQGSVYGGENSLDMADTRLPEGAFDLIISNHVLEHVPDDRLALAEMLRVVGRNGLVHVNVPTPTQRWQTEDWGFPDPAKIMHFRDYGADFAMLMAERVPGVKAMGVVATDPVTGIADIVYFFALSEAPLARFAQAWRGSHIAVVRVA